MPDGQRLPSSPVSNSPSHEAPGGDLRGFSLQWHNRVRMSRAGDYAEFRRLWDEAGRRNRMHCAFAEDHGEGWWISQIDAESIACLIRAARITEEARESFARHYAFYFNVYIVGADGIPVLT